MNSRRASKKDKQQVIDSLVAKLCKVSATVEKDIVKQVEEYISSLDETYISHTSGDTTRFADSVHIYLEDEYQKAVAERIAAIASGYATRYSSCLAQIDRLMDMAPGVSLSTNAQKRLDECREGLETVGMIDYIMSELARDGAAAAAGGATAGGGAAAAGGATAGGGAAAAAADSAGWPQAQGGERNGQA